MYLGHRGRAGAEGAHLRAAAASLHAGAARLDAGHRARKRQRIVLKGELPSPLDPPKGCVFSTRCPYVTDLLPRASARRCARSTARLVACHYAEDFLVGEPMPVNQGKVA